MLYSLLGHVILFHKIYQAFIYLLYTWQNHCILIGQEVKLMRREKALGTRQQ